MTPQQTFLLNAIIIFLCQMGAASLALYLAHQALAHIPMAQKFLQTSVGQLILFLLNLAVSLVLCYWIPQLRALHALYLITNPAVFAWPDMIFSALLLSRASYMWHWLFRYLEKRSVG